jgi:hypothetical protein
MREIPLEGNVEPLGLSIKETARITGESEWQVKEKLRNRTYEAKKSGRRTIVIYASVKAAFNNLPAATFKPGTYNYARAKRGTQVNQSFA